MQNAFHAVSWGWPTYKAVKWWQWISVRLKLSRHSCRHFHKGNLPGNKSVMESRLCFRLTLDAISLDLTGDVFFCQIEYKNHAAFNPFSFVSLSSFTWKEVVSVVFSKTAFILLIWDEICFLGSLCSRLSYEANARASGISFLMAGFHDRRNNWLYAHKPWF